MSVLRIKDGFGNWIPITSIKGEKGDTGATGASGTGIASAVLNADYTLTLTFTDGTSYTTPSIRGEKGEKGEQGDAGEVDTEMSASSVLPVQNRVIKSYVDTGLSGKADSADVPTKVSDLTNDSLFIRGNTGGVYYGTCSSAGSAVAKVVDCDTFTSDDLVAGAIILVQFENLNSGAVASLTMNVNGTGAKPIKYINNGSLTTVQGAGHLKADTSYFFVYDGTNWVAMYNFNSTYTSMSSAEAKAGTATSARSITAARLKEGVVTHAPVKSVNGDTGDVTVTVPTKTSDLTNDSGFITGYTETDPTVPAWAKASTKPTYTASEVGALPDSTVIPSALSDLTNDMSVSDFTNDAGYLTSYTETGIIEFDATASSGDDHDLTQILTSLGWLNDVIV